MISQTITQNLVSLTGWTPPLEPSLPVQSWQLQRANYRSWWDWYSGEALERVIPNVKAKSGAVPYMFPLKINPIDWVCTKHVAGLFGEVPDYADTNFEVGFTDNKGQRTEVGDSAADILTTIWAESNGREIQIAGATASQFLGGCFFSPRYEPLNKNLSYKIRFEHILPDFVLPIYAENDPWNLLEAWVMYYISPQEAESRFNIKSDGNVKKLYAEHWTKDTYEVMIDGVPASGTVNGFTIEYKGKNPYGEIPIVYVPHPPRLGTYYGRGHVDSLVGLMEEFNRRISDTGDLVQDESYKLLAMRNVSSKVDSYPLGDDRHTAIHLGNTGMTGKDPDLFQVTNSAGSPKLHMEFLHMLLDMIDRTASLSPVSYGEDEGSQRSGVTLAARMWPLAAHVRVERAAWTAAMKQLHRMTLRMMKSKSLGGITDAHLAQRPQIGWFSMLPLDRDAIVKEVTGLLGVKGISRYDARKTLSDGSDVQEQVNRIEADMEFDNKLEMELAKANPAPAGGFAAAKT